MKAGDAGRLHAWLAEPRVVDVDPATVRRLREGLAAGSDDPPTVTVEPHGTVVVRERPRPGLPPRRVLELDRGGTALAALRWTEDGRLARAWVRVADASWVMIEPRATREAPWGPSDRLWHATHPSAHDPIPLTILESVPYERVDRIPVLAEPGRLPPAAAGAVLNLIAALALDGGPARLAYRRPYPGEELFLTLLGSFRYHTDEADPLAAFRDGRLEWSPAPHERVCLTDGLLIRLRGRVESVTWEGRTYHRPDWQGIERHAPRRVRDVDGGVVCSLWALGDVVADHLRLDPAATAVDVIASAPPDVAPSPLPPAVMAGIASAAAALGATPLAPFVREVGAACELAWAPVDCDLVGVDGDRFRVSSVLRDALVHRLRAAQTRARRLALGVAALTELAHLFGDVLRARAQARVADLPEDAQARVVEDGEPAAAGNEDARRIAAAVESLVDEVSRG